MDDGQRRSPSRVPLSTVAREWLRIGTLGFGGPPTHIRLLRDLCVEQQGWLSDEEFEHAVASCNLLPGPASTQLAIYCAWRVGGPWGAVLGGVAFILPGLIAIIALSAIFLGEQVPVWIAGAAAGAGACVAAVAAHAGWLLAVPSWRRRSQTWRWFTYVVLSALVAAARGPWVVVVLLACGLAELFTRERLRFPPALAIVPPTILPMALGPWAALAWVAVKVGALSYGGGFVIVPLMQSDAVDRYRWLSAGDFLGAVALGQITPGPVVLTIAAVGFAAAGVAGALFAALMAFAPSFCLILLGAPHFERFRGDARAQAFLDGSGPAAIGAILGSAVPLAASLMHGWQYLLLALSAANLFLLKRGAVSTLLGGGVIGSILVGLGWALA